ncbi:MAG: hypothetical protein A3J76_04380 [Candidatus Moranbacteria bacterium RBG_13_45_13]|nr:MAG: hypothetical protein A3J76_04380 [Candidatus Moranbacteria bacterium RBG_13_45_13]
MLKTLDNHQNNSFLLKGDNNVSVLLLHGWTSPPGELLPLAKYLNSFGYTVYAPLLRGHGTKPEDLVGVTWQDWFADSRKALAELKNYSSRIFVGGISMGGNLAMLLSEEDNVSGIIAMGPSVKYKLHNLAKLSVYLMGLTKTYRKKYYPPWVRKKMGHRDVYPYYPVESAKAVMLLTEETKKFLPRITKPILILQSTSDHMVSKKSPRMILEGVSSKVKEIYWVKDAYHVFAGDREVHEKIGEFISKVIKVKL